MCTWGCLTKGGFRTELFQQVGIGLCVLILWGLCLYLSIQMFVLLAVCIELGIGIGNEKMAGVCPVIRQTKAQEMEVDH